jgi:glycosyltransferase involved in cell wall biosynthesis
LSLALAILALFLGLPGAAAVLHLTLLTVASVFYREPAVKGAVPAIRFCVLIPAHNEEKVLGATLAAIRSDVRPGDLILVVADRCSDDTATIARAQGAHVLELQPGSATHGRAQARQRGVEYALGLAWDALLMIDADSRIEPGFFAACERLLATGAQALQARSEAALGPGFVANSYIAAFALQGITIPRGRDRLKLSVRLRGTGMVLRRSLVERFRFRAPASEDLWYSLDLCLAGVLPRHVDSARLRSESVRSWGAASGQRLRY